MSSIVTSSTGLRRIEVIVGGKRHKIRLGRMPVSSVGKLQVRIDALVEARALRRRDPDAEKWCEGLDIKLRRKLMNLGLLPKREDETLKGLIERIVASRTSVKETTRAADKQAHDSLIKFFGEEHVIQKITPLDAEEWRQDLHNSGLAPATVAKRVIRAKAVFAQAVRWRLLDHNPLGDLEAGSQKNESLHRYINPEMSRSVLDACPDAEWRAIFSLSRWGGLRIPSEIQRLTWSDFVWDKHRFRVASPKTEHHEGKAERWCPIFPEIESAMRELMELAEPGSLYVFSARRRAASNLRTSFMKIVRRAGLTPWPRLFQNLRSSRETELCERFPEHLVCKWLGNSPNVARKHYLQMLDHYFEQAAQKAAQPAGDKGRHASLSSRQNATGDVPEAVSQVLMGDEGLRDLTIFLRKLLKRKGCGAKSGALARAVVDFLRAEGLTVQTPAAAPDGGNHGG